MLHFKVESRRFAVALDTALKVGGNDIPVLVRGCDVSIVIPNMMDTTIFGSGSSDDPCFTAISCKVGSDGKLLVGEPVDGSDLKFGVVAASNQPGVVESVGDK